MVTTAAEIQIIRSGTELRVLCPYNPDFPAAAKKRGGKWTGDAWAFDARDEDVVRRLLIAQYGSDGTATDLVTMEIQISPENDTECVLGGPFVIAGRIVAAAKGRDTGAKTGDGVVVLSGGFRSGGSVKNWQTVARPNTRVRLHDIPRAMVEKVLRDYPGSLVTEQAPRIDPAALRAERDRLTARLAEIDALLAATDPA